MRVANVVLHCCSRAHKQAWGLMEKGVEMHLCTERPLGNFGWRDYESCALIYSGHLNGHRPEISQIETTIKMLSSHVDLFHVHNEPDWIVEVVKQNTDKPVVYDIHDMVSQRTHEVDEWERRALEACDAIVVPSRDYQEVLLKRGITKPIIEILSGVPEKLFPTQRRKPERLGIVYEGGLKGKPQERSEQFEFRSWAEVFRDIAKMNIGVWAYPSATNEDYSEYENSGIIVMPTFPYNELLKNLTAHEAGLVGSPFPTGAFDGALPNKMFEYITAGIPVIAINAPTAANFLEALGFGKGITDIKEIPDVLNKFYEEKTADYVWSMRKNWSMDRQVQKLLTLYTKLLGLPEHKAFEHLVIAQ